jgi:hypothetical protein
MADDDKKNGNGKSGTDQPSAADQVKADAEARQAKLDAAQRQAQMSPPDQGTRDNSMPLRPASGSGDNRDGDRRRGPRDMPGSNYSVHDRQRQGWEMPASDVLGDTAVHNAGNSGPVSFEPDYPVPVTRAPMPGGLMEPYINTDEAIDGIAPEATDPGLVAHVGSGSGLSAHEDAAQHHFRMRMGELRNFLRDVDHKMIADKSLRGLAQRLKGIFFPGQGAAEGDKQDGTGRDDTPWRDGGRQRNRSETDAAMLGTGASREERRQEPGAARPAEVDPNA